MDTNEIDEVVQEFLLESYENLDRLDDEFLELERDPSSTEVLASIFRTIHTIKGTAGFLGFDRLGQLTHAGENLLSRLRSGDLTLNQPRTSALLSLVDAVREMLAAIEQAGDEGVATHDAVMTALNAALLDDETAGEVVAAALEELAATARSTPSSGTPEEGAASGPVAEADDAAEPEDDAGAPAASALSPAAVEADQAIDPNEVVVAADGDGRRADGARSSLSDSSVRVDVSLLDNLMNLVGELVLARNRIMQVSATETDSLLHNTAQQLNLVTSELQEEVMRTRLQPILTIWGRFPRVVRDLALTCEKQVRIEMTGEETELDRTIVEAIRDPLTHMIRNAVDHGIEAPAVREANGKPAEGTVWLSAFHEGSQVNIEMRDDGGGIDLEAVGAKAVNRGLITAEQLERMSDDQIVDLIFEPGLSTAAAITNVSGRGVGMDVVRSNIEKIGGSVVATTVPGHGTTMRMKIPLTLAIVPALVVEADDQSFAVPQVNVVELVRLDGEKATKAIERVGQAKVHRLRGKLLPVLDLREALGLVDLPKPAAAPSPAPALAARPSAPTLPARSPRPSALASEPGGDDALKDKLRARAFAAIAREQGDGADAAPQVAPATPAPPAGNDLRSRALAALAAERESEPVAEPVVASAPVAGNDLRSRALAALAAERETEPVAEPVVASAPVVGNDLRARALAALAAEDDEAVEEDRVINIVVLKAENTTFGLIVDRIDQTQEIVVKPLGAHLKDLPVYAGTTVMGDGHVALILDAVGIAKRAQLTGSGHTVEQPTVEQPTNESANHESVLVCRVAGNRVALELPVINRLEFLPADRVEWSNGREVVQYHDGRLLHLVRIEEFLARSGDAPEAPDMLRVIVCERNDGFVGLVVDDIVDIAARNVNKQQIRNEGIVTVSAVVGGKVTDLLDVDLILAASSAPALSRW